MRRLLKFMGLLALALGLSFATSNEVEAQEMCAHCENDFIGGYYAHRFFSAGTPYDEGPYGVHGDWKHLNCGNYHDTCELTEEEEDLADAELLATLVDEHDVVSINALLATSDRIVWNVTRSALQLTDCEGHVVAHIPAATLAGQFIDH